MNNNNISPEQLEIFTAMETRIRKRYARRTELLSHLIAFVISIAVMWLVIRQWLPDFAFWTVVGVIVTGGWGMGLLIHFVQALSQEMEDLAIMREMERFGLLADYKRKNEDRMGEHQRIGLGDDGELIELATYDQEEREAHYE